MALWRPHAISRKSVAGTQRTWARLHRMASSNLTCGAWCHHHGGIGQLCADALPPMGFAIRCYSRLCQRRPLHRPDTPPSPLTVSSRVGTPPGSRSSVLPLLSPRTSPDPTPPSRHNNCPIHGAHFTAWTKTLYLLQILGNNECFEPYTSNLYARRTLAGEFFVLNRHLQRELQDLGMWNRMTRDKIIAAGGSVQQMEGLPAALRAVFKTAWEMKQRVLIDMAAERGESIINLAHSNDPH